MRPIWQQTNKKNRTNIKFLLEFYVMEKIGMLLNKKTEVMPVLNPRCYFVFLLLTSS